MKRVHLGMRLLAVFAWYVVALTDVWADNRVIQFSPASRSFSLGVRANGMAVLGGGLESGGSFVPRAFLVDATGTLTVVPLATLRANDFGFVFAVSNDGNFVGGASVSPTSHSPEGEATVWNIDQPGSPIEVGYLPSAASQKISEVFGLTTVNGEPVAVGESDVQAFKWTPSTGIVALAPLNPGTQSAARSVSLTGEIIVGVSEVSSSVTAGYWNPATFTVLAGGDFPTSAVSVSPNGNYIVGSWFQSVVWKDLVAIPVNDSTGQPMLGEMRGVTDSGYAVGEDDLLNGIIWHESWTGAKLFDDWYQEVTGEAVPAHVTSVRGVVQRGNTLHFAIQFANDTQGGYARVDIGPAGGSAPVANAGGPYTVNQGGTVSLSGAGTTDPDLPNDTLTYAWDLDGDSVFGETGAAAARGDETGVSPTFNAAGLSGGTTVDISLRVTDSLNLSSTATSKIDVVGGAPVADAGGPYSVPQGKTVTLDGSKSKDADLPNDALTYVWDLDGDNIFGESGSAATRGTETGVKPVFSALGLVGGQVRTVKLKVTDRAGHSSTASATVNITSSAPVADAGGPYRARWLRSIVLNGTATDADLPNDALTFAWDLDGDGRFGETGWRALRGNESGPKPTFYAITLQSSLTVKLRVTDQSGKSSTVNATIKIVP